MATRKSGSRFSIMGGGARSPSSDEEERESEGKKKAGDETGDSREEERASGTDEVTKVPWTGGDGGRTQQGESGEAGDGLGTTRLFSFSPPPPPSVSLSFQAPHSRLMGSTGPLYSRTPAGKANAAAEIMNMELGDKYRDVARMTTAAKRVQYMTPFVAEEIKVDNMVNKIYKVVGGKDLTSEQQKEFRQGLQEGLEGLAGEYIEGMEHQMNVEVDNQDELNGIMGMLEERWRKKVAIEIMGIMTLLEGWSDRTSEEPEKASSSISRGTTSITIGSTADKYRDDIDAFKTALETWAKTQSVVVIASEMVKLFKKRQTGKEGEALTSKMFKDVKKLVEEAVAKMQDTEQGGGEVNAYFGEKLQNEMAEWGGAGDMNEEKRKKITTGLEEQVLLLLPTTGGEGWMSRVRGTMKDESAVLKMWSRKANENVHGPLVIDDVIKRLVVEWEIMRNQGMEVHKRFLYMKTIQDVGKNDRDVIHDLMEKMTGEGKGEMGRQCWQKETQDVAGELSAWVRGMKDMVGEGRSKEGKAFTTTQQVLAGRGGAGGGGGGGNRGEGGGTGRWAGQRGGGGGGGYQGYGGAPQYQQQQQQQYRGGQLGQQQQGGRGYGAGAYGGNQGSYAGAVTNRSNGSRHVEKGVDGASFTGPEKIMEKLNEQLKEQGKASVEIIENEAAKTKTVWVNPRQYKSVGYNQRAEGTRIYCSYCGWNNSHTDGGCLVMQVSAIMMPQSGYMCQYMVKK